ncbi:MAG: hypothetical protein CMA12_08645 [Euryarchaeota archaeon]|nr:hypothetical protein [Euryarchaeota archaeon]
MDIKAYNNLENINKGKLPNKIVECFAPYHFEKSGYPTKIKKLNELSKYFDVMQENRYFQNIESLQHITDEEFQILKKIANKIKNFSNSFNKFSLGRNTITRCLISKRIIDNFLNKKSTILEIGPGSGYFASFAYETNIKYYGMEITQAFYLYQSKFYKKVYNEDYANLAETKNEKKINQIPWWEWVSNKIKIKFDLIVANHVLCEMHSNSLIYTFKKSIDLFKNPEEKIIVSEGIGSREFSSPEHVVYLLKNIGWNLVHANENIYIFVHNSSSKKFINNMKYKRKFNFQYLRYIIRNDKKNILNSFFFLLKFLIKKDSYYHELENRILKNYNFKKIKKNNENYVSIEILNNFFDNKKNNNLTEDENFLNYIKFTHN